MKGQDKCRLGHDMTDPDNLTKGADGYRRCLACRRQATREREAVRTGQVRRMGINTWPTTPMGKVRPVPAEATVGLDSTAIAACADHLDVFDGDDKWLQARICDACPLAQWCGQKVAA